MIMHASAVAVDGRGVLIVGASGSGKSTLALALMARGAVLVSDDRTMLHAADGCLHGAAPPALAGLIEARGIGVLYAEHAPAKIVLMVDMAEEEVARLPQAGHRSVLGIALPLVLGAKHEHLADAILQYLKGGRRY
ncbi:HPr kinase/phosphorylase [Falsirhodobacter sp. alg1]|uniref:HPr kinase/phosphorylase n=1 Tax=Falsirhodobacter sp. alg1 TaxID=1472418 RepID=UPI0005EE34C5|nr:HPr kinase/phosphatase C-terminal domain-containing protein [Falsirhodobacter sp. alg1]